MSTSLLKQKCNCLEIFQVIFLFNHQPNISLLDSEKKIFSKRQTQNNIHNRSFPWTKHFDNRKHQIYTDIIDKI